MISAKGLTKRYGAIAAVEDVTFEVEAGEIIGFLGPNGAGKTTTMRILTGFTPATSGEAKVAGFDVSDSPLEVKRRVGYLPENVPLYPEMVVEAYLRYVARVKGVGRSEMPREVGRVLERCGLAHMRSRVIGNLSKGYRQRVGLAQALVGKPPVLILDEPTVGLDPKQIIEIRNMIKELGAEHTVLLSTHILPEVAMVCERVLIIHEGRIVAQDTMENLGAKERKTIVVHAAGPESKVLETVTAVAGVETAAKIGDGVYRITCADGADPSSSVVSALVQAGTAVERIYEDRQTLEEVFVNAISKEGASTPAEAGAA